MVRHRHTKDTNVNFRNILYMLNKFLFTKQRFRKEKEKKNSITMISLWNKNLENNYVWIGFIFLKTKFLEIICLYLFL